MRWVFMNFLPLVCVLCAAVLAWRGVDGWGWFLFVAVLGAVQPATRRDNT